MPTRFTEFHISSPVPSMSLRAKDHLEGTKVAVFPRYCAENKVQTGSAAAGGHRRVATRKTTGDLATRRSAGDPETRAEWMKVLRYGHLRSAPVVVDVSFRTEWEPPTLRAALSVSTRLTRAPPRWLLASPTTKMTDDLLSSWQCRTLRRVLCCVKRVRQVRRVARGAEVRQDCACFLKVL